MKKLKIKPKFKLIYQRLIVWSIYNMMFKIRPATDENSPCEGCCFYDKTYIARCNLFKDGYLKTEDNLFRHVGQCYTGYIEDGNGYIFKRRKLLILIQWIAKVLKIKKKL